MEDPDSGLQMPAGVEMTPGRFSSHIPPDFSPLSCFISLETHPFLKHMIYLFLSQ